MFATRPVLVVISSSKAFLETALSFLKKFAERKSFSEIRDDDQELVMLTMVDLLSQSSVIHWRAPGPFSYTHRIVKLLYAIIIYLFYNQHHQENPRKPLVVPLNLTRIKETQIHQFL